LRAEIESHIQSRLGSQQAEILRVQGEITAALTRLAEQLTADAGADPALSVAIADHLRHAHGQGAEAAKEQSARTRVASDMALMKAAVADLDEQRSQADVLNALVNRAAGFAPRVAFFVVKNERATGWRARGLEGTVGDDGVREISLPLDAQTVLGEAVRARSTWSGAPGANEGDHELLQKLGGDPPQRMIAIPLVARDRAVAVLYADSGGLEPDAVNLEALETLVRVAGLAVELLAATKRPAPAPRAEQPAAPQAEATQTEAPAQEWAAPEPQPAAEAPPAATEEAQVEEAPSSAAQFVEETQGGAAQAAEETWGGAPQPAAAEETWARPDEAAAEVSAPALVSPVETTTPPTAEQAAQSDAQPTAAPQAEAEERGIAPFTEPPPEAAAATEPTATPLGTSRRWGADAALPVEVGEDERRFHNDARRFARLLVSEIKLYNEQKVRDGRAHADLYERLREEIDRSRQMYDKRADPRVTARYDYFHHELVNTLAEGDADKLGREYPGAVVAA
jgi:hypothetical protein